MSVKVQALQLQIEGVIMTFLELMATLKLNKDEYDQGLKDAESEAESGGSRIGSAFSKIASVGVKTLTASIAAAGAGVAALTTAAVKNYAEYEQLVGGVSTLFGTQDMSLEEYAKSVGQTTEEAKAKYESLEAAQSLVMKNASEAYKNAGLSANEYMKQATSTAAALVSSLGGDTEEAARLADVAIVAMSDNANKMGSDIESLQNAYNGFAKGNFTMLDNLKLGYGGTKEEMERLLEDAEKISGIEYDVSSYADIVSAIQVVQEEMGIAGTTADEAEKTIAGSFSMMKSSWENLMTSLGTGEGISENIDALVSSASTLFGNLMPIVEQALTGISSLIEELVPKLMEEIPNLINDTLPQIVEAGANITQSILTGISENVGTITTGITDTLLTLIDAVVDMLPEFVSTGIQIITSLITGLSEAIPSLIPQITEAVIGIVDAFIDNADQILDAGIILMENLFEGLMEALPTILDAIPTIVEKIANFLSNNVGKIVEAAGKLLNGIVQALPTVLSSLASSLPQIVTTIINTLTTMLPSLISQITALLPQLITSLVSFFTENLPTVVNTFINLLLTIVDSLPEVIDSIVDALPDLINAIVTTIADSTPEILEAAIEALMGIVDAIPDIITSLVENLPEIIETIVTALVSSAPQILTAAVTALGGILEAIGDIIMDIPDKLLEIIGAIVDGIAEWGSQIFDGAVEAFANIFDGLVEGAVDIWDWITDLPSKLLEKLKEVWDGLVQIGKEIVNGIWEGIKGWFSAGLSSKFKSKLKEMEAEAKTTLEVNSPSKVFMRIGESVGEGFWLGFDDSMGDVEKEVNKQLSFNAEPSIKTNTDKLKAIEEMETATTITASSTNIMKIDQADIDKITKGMSITLYNTTEIDGQKIKEQVYTYTVDRVGNENRALQMAQGGV